MELSGFPSREMILKSRKRKDYFDDQFFPRLIEDENIGFLRIPGTRSIDMVLSCDDDEFKDFIMQCLQIDPEKRLSAS